MTTTPPAQPTGIGGPAATRGTVDRAGLPPARDGGARAPVGPRPRRGWLDGLARDTGYALLGLPLAILSFVVVITGLSLSLGLLVTLLGLPVAVGTLAAAKLLAVVERSALAARDGATGVPASYRPPRGGRWGWLARLADPQAWLDVAHAIVAFPVAIVAFVLTVTWWALALGGLTYWYWGRFLPQGDGSVTLPELLGFAGPAADVAFYSVVGVLAALTVPAVTRGSAVLRASLARVLLANPQLAAMRARVADLTATRAAAVSENQEHLRRLERDIHDGPQQRLVRLTMDLAAARRRLADDPEAADARLAEAEDQVAGTLAELRALSRGISPPVLADRGLGAALGALAARCTVEARLDVALPEGARLPEQVEVAAYFVVAEALTNVAKHSAATQCSVTVARERGRASSDGTAPASTTDVLRVVVTDDGAGGAHLSKGHGLAGLADRLAAVDGTLAVDSPTGGPTVVTAVIPCG